MTKYPIFVNLQGKRVVIVGAGVVALRKIHVLLEAGAHLIVVAEKIHPELETVCKENQNVRRITGAYSQELLSGATLAIAATNDRRLNKQVYDDCQQHGVLCNVVDDPELCDFFAPAVVHRGPLQIAISTNGLCPAYAAHVRKKLDLLFTDIHAQFILELECMRAKVISDIVAETDRKSVMTTLVGDDSLELFTKDGVEMWRRYAIKLIGQKHDSAQKEMNDTKRHGA
jgi:siroheme synthase-like protein